MQNMKYTQLTLAIFKVLNKVYALHLRSLQLMSHWSIVVDFFKKEIRFTIDFE